jgi:fucose permease
MLIVARYTTIVCTPPFPVVVVAFLPIVLGAAFSLTLNNSYYVNIGNASVSLEIFHSIYRIGGIIGPIMTTGLISHSFLWSWLYTVAVGLAVFSSFVFWSYRPDAPAELSSTADRAQPKSTQPKVLIQTLKFQTTLVSALFIFAYQGTEVNISR